MQYTVDTPTPTTFPTRTHAMALKYKPDDDTHARNQLLLWLQHAGNTDHPLHLKLAQLMTCRQRLSREELWGHQPFCVQEASGLYLMRTTALHYLRSRTRSR
jgi:hypothetical protein